MALGDIGTIQDTCEFDDSFCTFPRVVSVSANVFAVVYEAASNKIFVRTLRITDTGQITGCYISTIEIEDTNGALPHIVRMYGNIYAVVYCGPVLTGQLKTIEILPNGQITAGFKGEYEFYGDHVDYVAAVKVTNNMLAVVFDDLDTKARIRTIEISNAGVITTPYEDHWACTPTTAVEFEIFKVGDNTFAVTYRDNLSKGQVLTVTIAANGDITESLVDSLEFSGIDAITPRSTHVAADAYAVVFRRSDGHGQITTFTITSAGAISDTVKENYIFEGTACFNPHVIYVGGNFVLVAYEGPSAYGQLATIKIADDGDITTPSQDTYEYVENATGEHSAFAVTALMFAVAHVGLAGDGYVDTFPITTPQAQVPRHELVLGIG